MKSLRLLLIGVVVFSLSANAPDVRQKDQTEQQIAARFAPIFYQALGDKPRSDYITNFDFDGDWRGDNNWENAASRDLALKAYIYYSVAETTTHLFIHYAVFHPRDYKGGEVRGAILSGLIREGAKRGAKYDPTGLADEATLAHENDMEGVLVVARKNGRDLEKAEVVFVETLAHNKFLRYETSDGRIKIEGQRPVLYIEPKGHGIDAFVADSKQTEKKEFVRYVFTGHAQEPDEASTCSSLATVPCTRSVGFDLISLANLWTKAKEEPSNTYGVKFDYGEVKLSTNLNNTGPTQQVVKVGNIGCAFLGSVGGINMARPPWGWFDRDEKDEPLGQWFFDPAVTIKRHYNLGAEFPTAYIKLPFWAKST